MKIKNILAYTNPFGWIAAIPLGIGIILSAMSYSTYKNTEKIVKKIINEDLKNESLM